MSVRIGDVSLLHNYLVYNHFNLYWPKLDLDGRERDLPIYTTLINLAKTEFRNHTENLVAQLLTWISQQHNSGDDSDQIQERPAWKARDDEAQRTQKPTAMSYQGHTLPVHGARLNVFDVFSNLNCLDIQIL